MLRSVKEITGYMIQAKDGKIGRCKDFLFDDEMWTIRYMVADTGKWLPDKKVLISPVSLGEPDWASNLFPVRLSKKQIEQAPELDDNAPVSRQYEIKYHEYFGWPLYWQGLEVWGPYNYPGPLFSEKKKEGVEVGYKNGDPHLRSAKEVTGYHIHANDGEIGHVEDFIVDDQTWTIRYMVIDTSNWLPGSRKVLVSPTWIDSVDWLENRVGMDLTVDQIKQGPEYDPSEPINPTYEVRLYDFYGRPKYW
jgi:sporulation protein YlmC with PRC-barrel domain